jgi:quinol monooxygenase YgiN
MRMSYVVSVRWVAEEGEEEAVAAAVERLAEASRAEPGVQQYQPHRDPEDPKVFFLYERYDDEAASKAHVESEHFKRWGLEEAIPRLADRRREVYEALD